MDQIPITESEARVMLGEGAIDPPWVDESDPYNEEAVAHLHDAMDRDIRSVARFLVGMTREQLQGVMMIYAKGACYGWDAAMHNGPMAQRHAAYGAISARRHAAAEKKAKIRAAWDAAAQTTGEVDIEALAKELGVSRATVYRAMKDDTPEPKPTDRE